MLVSVQNQVAPKQMLLRCKRECVSGVQFTQVLLFLLNNDACVPIARMQQVYGGVGHV